MLAGPALIERFLTVGFIGRCVPGVTVGQTRQECFPKDVFMSISSISSTTPVPPPYTTTTTPSQPAPPAPSSDDNSDDASAQVAVQPPLPPGQGTQINQLA
jgi:hypothetical protein